MANNKENFKNAVIYARFSSHSQQETSIEGQLRECYAYAQKNNMIVLKEYIDRAKTGTNDNREGFQQMMKDSYDKKFQFVIMYTLDRFARSRYDAAINKHILLTNGVKLIYVQQPIMDNPEGIIFESLLEGYAEYYSANLSRAVKRGMNENALKALSCGGSTLFGYKVVDKKYELHERNAPAVLKCFEMYSTGSTFSDIAKYLNDNHFTTSKKGKFNVQVVANIIGNERYTGKFIYGETIIQDGIPRIVSDELFKKCNEIRKYKKMANRKKQAEEPYLLTGKLFCGLCGEPMVGESGKSANGNVFRYYKCSNQKRNHACNKHTEKKNEIENFVLDQTKNEVLTDENIALIAERAVKKYNEENNEQLMTINSLKKHIEDDEKIVRKYLDILGQQGAVDYILEDLNRITEEIKAMKAEIEERDYKLPVLDPEGVKAWFKDFKDGKEINANYEETLINAMVNKVIIYDVGEKGRRIAVIYNINGRQTEEVFCSDFSSMVGEYGIYPNIFKDKWVIIKELPFR